MTAIKCSTPYSSQEVARASATRCRRPDGTLWRLYRCVHCGSWHLGGDGDRENAVDRRMFNTYQHRRRVGRHR